MTGGGGFGGARGATGAAGASGISGLTTNTLPKATSATTIGDSNARQSGSVLIVDNEIAVEDSSTIFAVLEMVGGFARLQSGGGATGGMLIDATVGLIQIEAAGGAVTVRANSGALNLIGPTIDRYRTVGGAAQFERAVSASVQTTTGAVTPVTAVAFQPPVSKPIRIEAKITATEPATEDRKSWHLAAGGGRLAAGSVAVDGAVEDVAGPSTNDGVNTATWDATINTGAGDTFVVDITGEAAKTINWIVTVTYSY